MQTEYLLDPIYYQIKKARVSTNHPEALKRWDALLRFEQAMSKGLSSCDAAQIVGIPKATLYRWRARKTLRLDNLIPKSRRPKRIRRGKDKSSLKKRIVELRAEHPTWGKRKICYLLVREGSQTNPSAVGRIISALIRRGSLSGARGAAHRAGRKYRPQRPHAIRLKRGQRLHGKKARRSYSNRSYDGTHT